MNGTKMRRKSSVNNWAFRTISGSHTAHGLVLQEVSEMMQQLRCEENVLNSSSLSSFRCRRRDHRAGRFWMDDVFCDGNETELADCRFGGWSNSDCEASEAAGVICATGDERPKKKLIKHKKKRKYRFKDANEMDVRLSGGRNGLEGQVEVCITSYFLSVMPFASLTNGEISHDWLTGAFQ